jgi:hypothetical protein
VTETHTGGGAGPDTRHPDADRAKAAPPVRPADRYGRRGRRRTSRWTVPLLTVLALTAGLAVAVTTDRNLRGPGITGTVTAFTTADDHVDIRFVVVRDRPQEQGTCTLRARSRQGEEVGHAEVTVAPGAERVTVDHRLATTARPVTGELVSCRYDG